MTHPVVEKKNYIREYRLLPKYQSGRFLVIEKDADTGYLKINEIIMTFAEMRKFVVRTVASTRVTWKRIILGKLSVDAAPPMTDCSEVYRIGQKTEGLTNGYILTI